MIRAFCLFLLAASALTAAGQPPPVEVFFKRPEYAQMTLSPDGKRLAAIARTRGHDALAVIEVDKRAAGVRVINFPDADVLRVHWTTNDRLLIAAGEAYESAGDAQFFGWYAVNADGSDLRHISERLTANPGFPSRLGARQARLRDLRYLDPDPQGGDNIIIAARDQDRRSLNVYRYHTKSGERKLLSEETPSSNVFNWLADRAGLPRVAMSHDKGIITMWYRDGEGRPWRKVDEGNDRDFEIRPIAFDYDNRKLYVAGRGGGDRLAVHLYDFEKGQLGERIAAHPEVETLALVFSRDKRRLLGYRYDADKPGVRWSDEHWARLQKIVDQALPQTINTLGEADQSEKRTVVTAYSDVSPAEFYLLDMEKRSLERLAASRPWIKPGEMSERKFVRYKARDGLEIPAYLTVPKHTAGKNLPLVVEIHDGPWIGKQSWNFNERAQFFASRGYAVLQPDFRGTFGYGHRHMTSSFGQWGLAMQDDIADGVEWLIREGIVDKNRVCLFGVHYGGYAALWGLMKTPDLYRCGVAFGPITDIAQIFAFSRNAPDAWLEDRERVRIGDPDRDREKFKSVSPLYHVARLEAPVLLAFGALDPRSLLKYGTTFRNALDRSGKKYEWVVYSDEGAWFGKDENRFDFYRRVEAFLKQHLK